MNLEPEIMLLEGLHIPLTTPFHPDGRLNLPKLAANVVRYSKSSAAGLLVLGPSGEPTLLTDDETHEVLRVAVQAAAPEKILIAGISRDSVHATLDLAEFAAEQNYDAILVGVPDFLALESGYSRLDSDQRPIPLSKNSLLERRTFFQTVADSSPLPVILLNMPSRTIPVPVARTVSSHPNIIGLYGTNYSVEIQSALIASLLDHTASIKREDTVTPTFAAVTARMKAAATQASASLVSADSLAADRTAAATTAAEAPPTPSLRTRTKSVGFQIICTNAPRMLDALNSGAVGIAPPIAAAAPQACYEVFAAWKDQDQPLAQEKQQRLLDAALLAGTFEAGALKYAADLNGYFGGLPRLPHLPPTGIQRAALEQLMKQLRN
ncbi:MAG: dihydrodipicolinate synthase family protein [Acidobacteriaceae bacterium]